jgi:type III pantothenate kinase
MEEARGLNHNYVGTEHLLLGLLREQEGVAAQVLSNLGLRLTGVREEVLLLLGQTEQVSKAAIETGTKNPRYIFEKPPDQSITVVPQIEKTSPAPKVLIAIDIGNSGIKFGKFAREAVAKNLADNNSSADQCPLPEPTATFELPITHDTGVFESTKLAKWCEANLSADTHWSIGSVHRGAGALLANTINAWARQLDVEWPIRTLVFQDLPLRLQVDEPAKVGIDRLLASLAANRLRAPDNAAIVIDLGTAITVDLVETDGAFAGGAILPGIGMASRALADQTDALPHIALEPCQTPPSPLGKSTTAAIEAGLYWGTVGSVTELVSQLSARLPSTPDVFITGGAAPIVVNAISAKMRVQFMPHLVLSGIALLESPADRAQKS